MVRKVIGRFAREMNPEIVNNTSPKARAGAKQRNQRTFSEARSKGIGHVCRPDE